MGKHRKKVEEGSSDVPLSSVAPDAEKPTETTDLAKVPKKRKKKKTSGDANETEAKASSSSTKTSRSKKRRAASVKTEADAPAPPSTDLTLRFHTVPRHTHTGTGMRGAKRAATLTVHADANAPLFQTVTFPALHSDLIADITTTGIRHATAQSVLPAYMLPPNKSSVNLKPHKYSMELDCGTVMNPKHQLEAYLPQLKHNGDTANVHLIPAESMKNRYNRKQVNSWMILGCTIFILIVVLILVATLS